MWCLRELLRRYQLCTKTTNVVITWRTLEDSIVVLSTVWAVVLVNTLFDLWMRFSLALQDLPLIHQEFGINYFPNNDRLRLFRVQLIWLAFLVGTWSAYLEMWCVSLSPIWRGFMFAKQVVRCLDFFNSKQIRRRDSIILLIGCSLQFVCHIYDFWLAIVSDNALVGWSALVLQLFVLFPFKQGRTERYAILCFSTFLFLRFVKAKTEHL